jgi:hypothetical protein
MLSVLSLSALFAVGLTGCPGEKKDDGTSTGDAAKGAVDKAGDAAKGATDKAADAAKGAVDKAADAAK